MNKFLANNRFRIFSTTKAIFPILFLSIASHFLAEAEGAVYPKGQELLGIMSVNTGRVFDKQEIKLEGFKNEPKVDLVSSAPATQPPLVLTASPEQEERYTKPSAAEVPAVLLMYGWPGAPGGINLGAPNTLMSLEGERISITDAGKKPINLLQAQWPGASLTKTNITEIKFESDSIPKSEYLNTDPYYASLLKELKKQYGGKLHVVCHSNAALKLFSAYLSMEKDEREGISLSLVDPFFPSESVQFGGPSLPALAFGYFIRGINWVIPTYKGDLYDWITYPITIFGDIFLQMINLVQVWGISKLVEPNLKFYNKDMIHMILRCFEDEKRLFSLLEKVEDHSLDIRQIKILTRLDGFGTRPTYKNLLKDKLISKINKKSNGSELKIESLPYGHNGFLGTPSFWDWVEKGIKNNSDNAQDEDSDSEWEVV